jgi:heme/copper-type cytochrome/quinol oxidase subunit 2
MRDNKLLTALLIFGLVLMGVYALLNISLITSGINSATNATAPNPYANIPTHQFITATIMVLILLALIVLSIAIYLTLKKVFPF